MMPPGGDGGVPYDSPKKKRPRDDDDDDDRDDEDEDEDDSGSKRITRDHYNHLRDGARLLCWVMTIMEKEYPRYVTHLTQERSENESLALNTWWHNHKVADAALKEKEAQEKKDEQILEDFFKGLTKEQRKALKKVPREILLNRLISPTLGGKKPKE